MTAQKTTEELKVRFLGGFQMMYGGEEIAGGRQTASQFSSLMQAVLFFRENGCSRSVLKETLFEGRDLENAQHAVRSIIYNAKKRLRAEGLPEADYITAKGGIYRWTEAIPVRSDTEAMEHYCDLAEEKKDDLERLTPLLQAVHQYSGSFLGGAATVPWAVHEMSRYRDLFRQCVTEAARILRERLRYTEMLELGSYAASVDPYAEWEALTIEAMSALGRFREAEKLCSDTVQAYIDEFGRREPAYIRDLANRLSAGMVHEHADIESIQNSLVEGTPDGHGGFFCPYPVFQGVYRTLDRMMNRYADRFYLMLCTILDSKGNIMEDGPRLDVLSDRLQKTILATIRYSDTVSRYGKGQFLVLLTNTTRDDCEIVRRRIDQNFMNNRQRTGVDYQIRTAILTPGSFPAD